MVNNSVASIEQQWGSTYPIEQTIDTCGTRCPIPLLRAKKALKSLSEGQYLLVLATDPSAKGDFDAMLKHLPHQLVEYEAGVESAIEGSDDNQKRVDYFLIQKG